MTRIIFPDNRFDDLQRSLRATADESCAIILASQVVVGKDVRLLVREIHPAQSDWYSRRSAVHAELTPQALVPLIAEARQRSLSVIFVHTHPHSEYPEFSTQDDEGERHLSAFMKRRVPKARHAAIVMGDASCAARELGTQNPADVLEIGASVRLLTRARAEDDQAAWDRQIRAFGQLGQAALRRARVGIVGLGGTGSIVAQQLAHLGVTDFLLIDPDVVEVTNLNRLVGAGPEDVGSPKVSVAKESILCINPAAKVRTKVADVANNETALGLVDMDAIFGCTDSHASRAVLNQLSYQYYVPLFDVGVGIRVHENEVTHIAGRAQMVSPGLACLVCAGVIDGAAVRRELLSETERKRDPYISGIAEPEPAVITFNGIMSSLLTTMFMAAFAPVPAHARLQYYNGISGTVRAAIITPNPACVVCSRSGALGLGSEWVLPGRQGSSA